MKTLVGDRDDTREFLNPYKESFVIVEDSKFINFYTGLHRPFVSPGLYRLDFTNYTHIPTLYKIFDALGKQKPDHDALFLQQLERIIRSGEQKSTELERPEYVDNGYFEMDNYHTGLRLVQQRVDTFISSKDTFHKNSLPYRLSILLFGEQGIGKSRYLDHLVKQLIANKDAVVFVIDTDRTLDSISSSALDFINQIFHNQFKVFLFPNLENLKLYNPENKKLFARFLDSAAIQEDVLFLSCTDSPQFVPSSLINQTTRFDLIVNCESKDYSTDFKSAWYRHLVGEEFPKNWKSHDFYNTALNAGQLRQIYMATKIYSVDIDTAWKASKAHTDMIKDHFLSPDDENRQYLLQNKSDHHY